MEKLPIAYTVSYKKVNSLIWKRLKGVVEDGIIPDTQTRFFINSFNERFEIPLQGIMFKFSKERAFAIEEDRKEKRIQEELKAAEESSK